MSNPDPNSWTQEKIGDIFNGIKSGGTPKRGEPKYWENGTIPFVKIEDLNSQRLEGVTTAAEKTTKKAVEDKKTRVFNPGTILLTIYGTIGQTALVKQPVATNQGIIGLWDPVNTNPLYARYALDYERTRLSSKSRETTQANIGKEILKLHEIPHPPLPEQRKIASVLHNFDRAIQLGLRDELKRIKEGVMQDLLTGEVRTKDKDIEVLDAVQEVEA